MQVTWLQVGQNLQRKSDWRCFQGRQEWGRECKSGTLSREEQCALDARGGREWARAEAVWGPAARGAPG